jgi:thiol:disulfide interchange protein DsbD
MWSARDAKPDVAHEVAGGAEAFSRARLAALRAAGRPAFVDLTAAWCVTCLLNERVALDQAAVRAGFERAGVTYLVGDWTRGDPDITAYLKSHGRDGVPLYVFYPPGGAQPVTLPQILTPGLVLSAIGASAG